MKFGWWWGLLLKGTRTGTTQEEEGKQRWRGPGRKGYFIRILFVLKFRLFAGMILGLLRIILGFPLSFFFKVLFVCLFVCLCCARSSLWHMGSLVVACRLLCCGLRTS